MKKYTKVVKVALVLCLAVSCAFSLNTFVLAGDANHSFGFRIGSWHGNGRITDSEARYRSTTDPNNMWKVQLVTSGEGTGTITNFWLELYNEQNVSGDISAKQGTKQYYDSAYTSASRATVYLTGENNNYNGDTYYVSGFWDEETGKYAN